MSHLASIQKVVDVRPIEGADKIEVATVLGWDVVIKKNEFSVGDPVCYIQIDTIAPETEEFEFLRKGKFRVKTIKLKGQISQGLIVPVPKGKFKEGDDVTNIIGIKKYEKPDNNPQVVKPKMPKKWHQQLIYKLKYNYLYRFFPSLMKKSKSDFPKHLVPITDEERIQNVPRVIHEQKGKMFRLSYKLDGSSITIIHDTVKSFFGKTSSIYRICSRRFELHDTNNDWQKVFDNTNFKVHIDALVSHYKTNEIIVQGEAIGRFNGNHHKLENDEIRLFNLFVNGKKIGQDEMEEVFKQYNIPYCPTHSIIELNHTIPEILEISQIPDLLNPNAPAEGLVWRTLDGKVSFKAINNKYLLTKGE